MRFVYIGGEQPSTAVHTDVNGNVTLDESQNPTEAPDKCHAFGLDWRKGEPIDVKREMFRSGDIYENVVRRLQVNRFFKALTEDAQFEDVPPKRGPGRPPKALQAPQAEPDE